MSRLYLRIYLTVLGSLLVFALLAGLAGILLHVFEGDDGRGVWWPEAGTEIAERLLPADRGPAALATELRFWKERTGFSLLLLSPQGKIVAQAGKFPPRILERARDAPPGRWMWRGWGGVYGLTLSDGRRLLAVAPDREFHSIRSMGWLAALLGIAIAVGISAYPLIRYLARRLERLEQGVAAFGGGDLSARVAITGRDEIARLASTFNASADRIEALLNAHKTLLANASHELRSPLSRLRMAIERLQTDKADGAVQTEIRRNIEELDALVEEILLASRLQANEPREGKREPVDLVGLLAEECARYDAELNVPSGATPAILGNGRLLRRLFRNLLENAARYGGDEPTTVTVSPTPTEVRIAVCDRGPGVPEPEREKIFEPFHRLKSVPESAGGAGLGLALVRQIAERHDGKVECLPRSGGGACFDVWLPIVQ